MKVLFNSMSRFEPYAVAILRIVVTYAFILNGTTKLFGIPVSEHMFPALFSFRWFGGFLEVVLSVMIIIGFQTRLAAFLCSGMMAVAYFGFHAEPDNFLVPMNNGGEAAMLYCFVYLFLWIRGSGAWALDKETYIPTIKK